MAKMGIKIYYWLPFTIIYINLVQICCFDPRFDPTTRFNLVLIPADAAVGSTVFRVRAIDEEFDFPLIFALVGENSSSVVAVESLPCTNYNSLCQANIILQKRLVPGQYYDFELSVKDTKGGIAYQFCSFTATNFTTPHEKIFPHRPGLIIVSENARRGTELDYVTARKNPLLGQHPYFELWGSSFFGIRQKIVSNEILEGTIMLFGPLDFERQAIYHLTVLVIDPYGEEGQDTRNVAGLELVVIVQDVQDMAPIFTSAPPVTKIRSDFLPGDKVVQVHAEDGDKGCPREIRYGLVSEAKPFTSFFRINETSGEIFLKRSLDEVSAISSPGDPILLTVVAEEIKLLRDEPAVMATTVNIALILPEFSNIPPYFKNDQIDENAAQGTILQFLDPYVPEIYNDNFGTIGVFSLSLINNNGTFEISPTVGGRSTLFIINVRNNKLLDFEKRNFVQFQIYAQQLGPSTNVSTTVNVTVFINDVNDNPPKFSQGSYSAEIPENITAGTNILQVQAEDPDTGVGAVVRYTQIVGHLNTSFLIEPYTGQISISKNNHGLNREVIAELHLGILAADLDGAGNCVQVPLVVKITDINDETPIFEKFLYEFILSSDLNHFTSPSFIRAVDADATRPNNEVRYEIISGNHESQFTLQATTGELRVENRTVSPNRILDQYEKVLPELVVRAYDLGVPVRFSTAKVRVHTPEIRAHSFIFIVPGSGQKRSEIEDTLSSLTGGKIVIHDIKPLSVQHAEKRSSKDRNVITATVFYEGQSIVDISEIQRRLSLSNNSIAIMSLEEQSMTTVYRGESTTRLWILIIIAVLIAGIILMVLLCYFCSWCSPYARMCEKSFSTSNKRQLKGIKEGGKHSRSIQVAEWMGTRDAWATERSVPDSRCMPIRSSPIQRGNMLGESGSYQDNLNSKSADETKIGVHNGIFPISNSLSIREGSIDLQKEWGNNRYKANPVDIDSMRKYEIDRDSDMALVANAISLRETSKKKDNDVYIRHGNAEILQFGTANMLSEERLYVSLRNKPVDSSQMVFLDHDGKETLMRRYIEEQVNGNQFSRRGNQLDAARYNHRDAQRFHMNGSPLDKKHDGGSIITAYEQANLPEGESELDFRITPTAYTALNSELDCSIKQQNELLRRILEEKSLYEQAPYRSESALETQSLPCNFATIASQTECEASTQTDPWQENAKNHKCQSRRKNDELIYFDSDNDYKIRLQNTMEYNHDFQVKRIKRSLEPSLRAISTEQCKRKLESPIKEEMEERRDHERSLPSNVADEEKCILIPRIRSYSRSEGKEQLKSDYLNTRALVEISDSFVDQSILPPLSGTEMKRSHRIKTQSTNCASDESECNEININQATILSIDKSQAATDESYTEVHSQGERRASISMLQENKTVTNSTIVHPGPSKISRNNISLKPKLETASEPSYDPINASLIGIGESGKNHRQTRSEKDVLKSTKVLADLDQKSKTKTIPRYMEWYQNSRKAIVAGKQNQNPMAKGKIKKKKPVYSHDYHHQSEMFSVPPSSNLDKTTKSKSSITIPAYTLTTSDLVDYMHESKRRTATNHYLLQHSEHHYEREYGSVPDISANATNVKGYKNCHSFEIQGDNREQGLKISKQHGIEDKIAARTSKLGVGVKRKESGQQLSVVSLEDDIDSGIVMNAILSSTFHRNPIADRKSVFSIAYEEVKRVGAIQSENYSPQIP